jgi:hypothetical protein
MNGASAWFGADPRSLDSGTHGAGLVSGTVSGVVAVYNRYQFSDEMRAALTSWEQKLAVLLSDAR